jgi:hypothetical protein
LGKLENGGKVAATATSAADEKKASSGKGKKKGGGGKKKAAQLTEVEANKANQEREAALGDATKKMAAGEGGSGGGVMEQPASLKNGTLKPYQLEGLNWLSSLWMNGKEKGMEWMDRKNTRTRESLLYLYP